MQEYKDNKLKNLQLDLISSIKKDVVIDIKNEDMKLFNPNSEKLIINTAVNVYKVISENKKTNILYLDCSNYQPTEYIGLPILIAFLLEKLDEDIKIELNKTIIKNLTVGAIKGIFDIYGGTALKMATGGMSEFVSTTISSILIDQSNSVLNTLFSTQIDKIVEYPIDLIADIVEDKIENLEIDFQEKIYLSNCAKQEIKKIITELQNPQSFSKSFELLTRLIYVISIEHPKLIAIKYPHLMDEISLAIITKYFSISKNIISGKRIGTSFLYINHSLDSEMLKEQKLFLQRYNFLERLDSDIPFLAVKHNMFIGREEEKIKLINQSIQLFSNQNTKQITYINGDPGIGKTALYNEHIKDIFEKNHLKLEEKSLESIIRFEIHNEPGDMSVGISSFVGSIVKEVSRLQISFVKHASWLQRKTASTNLETLISFVPFATEVKKIGLSVFQRLSYDDKIIQETIIQSFQEENLSSKEKYFQDIYKSILDLQEISKKISNNDIVPIILFIDDLQWMDEDTAKFIVEYLLEKENINLHIIVTLRREDGKDIYNKLKNKQKQFTYLLKFLENSSITESQNTFTLTRLDTQIINLEGFDFKLLSALISKVIINDTSTQKASILAKAIIAFLDEKDYVTTLYAIEIINILCDKKFYEYHNMKCLIEIKDTQAFFINIDDVNFEKSLYVLLNKLRNTYGESFAQNKGFTLSSYAILEERLRLIDSYFGEFGSAIVFSIIISSALASPFDKEILQNVLKQIVEDESLKSLCDKLNHVITIDDKIEIFENIYEIIEKVVKYKYKYSHSLLKIFFDKKLEAILNNDEEVIKKFYKIIINSIEYQENMLTNNKSFNFDIDSINEKYYLNTIKIAALEKILNIIESKNENQYFLTLEKYLRSMIEISKIDIMRGNYKEAEYKILKIISITKQYIQFKAIYFQACVLIMNLYDLTGEIEEIIKISEEAKKYFTGEPSSVIIESNILNFEATYYWRKGQNEKAVELALVIIELLEKSLKEQKNDEILYVLMNSYYTIAKAYSYAGDYKSSFWYYDKTIEFATILNEKMIMSHAIIDKADDLYNLNQYDKALILANESLDLRKSIGDNNIVFILLTLGRIYIKQQQYSVAKENLNKALEISNKINSDTHIPTIYCDLAFISIIEKDFQSAEKYIEDAILRAEMKNEIFDMGYAYRIYGIYFAEQKDIVNSCKYFEKSISCFALSGYKHYEIISKLVYADSLLAHFRIMKNDAENYLKTLEYF